MYFKHFPRVLYNFGDEQDPVVFTQLNAYADVVESVKDDLSAYLDYTILDGDRPDQLAYKLYGDVKYYWTFFLMNDKLREQGWPLSSAEITDRIGKYFPHQFVQTGTDWFKGEFKVGAVATGKTSGASGKIIATQPDLGNIIIGTKDKFTRGELVEAGLGVAAETVVARFTGAQYDGPHHYEDTNGNIVDIDPITELQEDVSPAATKVTVFEQFIKTNDDLKEIKILKPDVVGQVQAAWELAMSN